MFGRVTASRRFNLLLSVFAGLALTIAATGIYGVIAFVASQRTREIGLRVALGAQRLQILALFLSRGATLLAAAIAAGLLGAWWLASTLREFLFQVEPRDVTVFFAVAVLLAIVGLVACWIPSRRARMDPLRALRTDESCEPFWGSWSWEPATKGFSGLEANGQLPPRSERRR